MEKNLIYKKERSAELILILGSSRFLVGKNVLGHGLSSDAAFSLEEQKAKHALSLCPYITPEGMIAALSGAGVFKDLAEESLRHLGLHFAEGAAIDLVSHGSLRRITLAKPRRNSLTNLFTPVSERRVGRPLFSPDYPGS